MTIVVAYTPDQYGAAALALAANEADHRSERVLVVSGSRSALRSDDKTATEEQLDQLRRDVTERGIACDIERVVGPGRRRRDPRHRFARRRFSHRRRHPCANPCGQAPAQQRQPSTSSCTPNARSCPSRRSDAAKRLAELLAVRSAPGG
jgi:hypothetical protein